jgi:hypothetical protein
MALLSRKDYVEADWQSLSVSGAMIHRIIVIVSDL